MTLTLRTLRVVPLMLVLWAVGCDPRGNAELRVPGGTPIALISVDTLRSDRLPAYGYGGIETPAIDRLRRDGVLFERAYTHVPLTLPAHTSLLTGLLPPAHGVRDNLGYSLGSDSEVLLQQRLHEAGYATGAAVSAYVLRRATGLAAGFDVYDDEVEFTVGAGVQAIQRPGRETLDAILPWLRSVAGTPFFLFLHLFEPHFPYEPPAHLASRYPSPYDGEVAAADEVVGALLDELTSLGAYDPALIVFLSDHGEGLGDHGEDEHGLFLYRSTLQVPLIVKLPQAERAGDSVSSPVQLIDVYPTILTALGLPPGEALEGEPLLWVERPEPRDSPVYAETFFPRLHFGWSELAALIDGRYHYIEAPVPELYDLIEDPEETTNLIDSESSLAEELRERLGAFDRTLVAPAETDPDTRQLLEALGYVGRAAATEGGVLPDPKTRVGTLAEIRDAYRLYADGDLESAVRAFERIVAVEPGIEDAWEYLAMAQLGLGRVEDAVLTYEAAIERLPNAGRLSLRLAMLLVRLGRLEEAYVQANLAIPYDAPAAHVLLAQIALEDGDLDGAEAEAREALSSGDPRPGPRLVLADIAMARGEPEAAAVVLSEALVDGDEASALRAKLAMIHLWVGDLDRAAAILEGFETTDDVGMVMAFGRLASARQRWNEARGWFERALVLDPGNANAALNFGIVLVTEGDVGRARPVLEEAVTKIPGSFEGWNALGVACVRQGDLAAATAAWERALEINPGAVDLLFNLGLVHAQAGHLKTAVGFLEDYAALAEAGPQRDRALAMVQRLRQRSAEVR